MFWIARGFAVVAISTGSVFAAAVQDTIVIGTVGGGNTLEERLPALRRRPPPPRHVFGYAGLPYIDPELEQLTMDPRGSP